MSEQIILKITGDRIMTCGGCENGVKMALSQVPGVEAVVPDRTTQMVTVNLKPEGAEISALLGSMANLGYQAEKA